MGATLLIVDDHAAFRGVARTIAERAGFTVVGESADAATALADAERLRPDALLVDVMLPDGDGFRLAESLALWAVPPRILLTSSRDAESYRHRLANAAVDGFVEKRRLTPARLAAILG